MVGRRTIRLFGRGWGRWRGLSGIEMLDFAIELWHGVRGRLWGGRRAFLFVWGRLTEAMSQDGPSRKPAVGANEVSESQHRIDLSAMPMHSCSLQSVLHHKFVGTFTRTGTNRPTVLPEGGVAEHVQAFLQVGDGFSQRQGGVSFL